MNLSLTSRRGLARRTTPIFEGGGTPGPPFVPHNSYVDSSSNSYVDASGDSYMDGFTLEPVLDELGYAMLDEAGEIITT